MDYEEVEEILANKIIKVSDGRIESLEELAYTVSRNEET